jgi:hypothetical protein
MRVIGLAAPGGNGTREHLPFAFVASSLSDYLNDRTGEDQFGRDGNNLAVEIGWIGFQAMRNICLCVGSTILSIIPFGPRSRRGGRSSPKAMGWRGGFIPR